MKDNVMSWGHSSLPHMLRYQEKVVPGEIKFPKYSKIHLAHLFCDVAQKYRRKGYQKESLLELKDVPH